MTPEQSYQTLLLYKAVPRPPGNEAKTLNRKGNETKVHPDIPKGVQIVMSTWWHSLLEHAQEGPPPVPQPIPHFRHALHNDRKG